MSVRPRGRGPTSRSDGTPPPASPEPPRGGGQSARRPSSTVSHGGGHLALRFTLEIAPWTDMLGGLRATNRLASKFRRIQGADVLRARDAAAGTTTSRTESGGRGEVRVALHRERQRLRCTRRPNLDLSTRGHLGSHRCLRLRPRSAECLRGQFAPPYQRCAGHRQPQRSPHRTLRWGRAPGSVRPNSRLDQPPNRCRRTAHGRPVQQKAESRRKGLRVSKVTALRSPSSRPARAATRRPPRSGCPPRSSPPTPAAWRTSRAPGAAPSPR